MQTRILHYRQFCSGNETCTRSFPGTKVHGNETSIIQGIAGSSQNRYLLAECSAAGLHLERRSHCMCLYYTESHISCFEPSGANGNWFKVGFSRYGDETISDSMQHQDAAASSSLLE